jgi:hypothetical protein
VRASADPSRLAVARRSPRAQRKPPARPRPGSAPVAASTLASGLPRSASLTDALFAPTEPEGTPARAVMVARRHLAEGLAEVVAAGGCRPGSTTEPAADPPLVLRIGHFQVARAGEGLLPSIQAGEGGTASPFRWTSRNARRLIGLAALRAGLDGRAATPADAVAAVLTDPGGPLGVGRTGPGSAADWIASLSRPARSLVAAEATCWATRLWSGVEWARFPPHRLVIGNPGRWWRWTGPGATCRVTLRGRADVRVLPEQGPERNPGAHLVVLDGVPRSATRQALLLSALVDGLSTPDMEPSPLPACVLGWWPDCGRAWIVPVDSTGLIAAAEAVVVAARALLGGDAPGGGGGRH